MDQLKARGYSIHIIFVWISSVQLALRRIADRVMRGGHSIPEPVVRRRFVKGLRNFFKLYAPLADSWVLIDNSEAEPQPIAEQEGSELKIIDERRYDKILQEVRKRI